jgi:hypothetical protein
MRVVNQARSYNRTGTKDNAVAKRNHQKENGKNERKNCRDPGGRI